MKPIERPYVLYVAETIYSDICQIKKKNPNFSNEDAINALNNFESDIERYAESYSQN